MQKRYTSIWFPFLLTDWWAKRNPQFSDRPVVFVAKAHGRLIVSTTNTAAQKHGIHQGVVAADAKAIVPGLIALDEIPGKAEQLLTSIGDWCIRFSPAVAMDFPDGLVLDSSGCAHLWGGEEKYLTHIASQFHKLRYNVRLGIADTIGMAWAAARFSTNPIVAPNHQATAISLMPPAALRLDDDTRERLHKLGFRTVGSFLNIKRSALRRRFGERLLQRLDQTLGWEREALVPLQPVAPYEERLPCLEPITTRTGIEIALQRLLDGLCSRLRNEGLGLRNASVTCYRVDNKIETIEVNTGSPSNNPHHLFRLFELKITEVRPALGIELFVLTAVNVEPVRLNQE
ncbi:MAG TPA: DNA polymerase Y family protein, partial [Chitinophagales bacterium]|nr:DNA polymerase Y family protein [Chitinophagales bacterium]